VGGGRGGLRPGEKKRQRGGGGKQTRFHFATELPAKRNSQVARVENENRASKKREEEGRAPTLVAHKKNEEEKKSAEKNSKGTRRDANSKKTNNPKRTDVEIVFNRGKMNLPRGKAVRQTTGGKGGGDTSGP